MPMLVHADNSTVLSSQGAIALSRCSSLHGSILSRIGLVHEKVIECKAINETQRTAQPLHVAANAKTPGEKHGPNPDSSSLSNSPRSLMRAPSVPAYLMSVRHLQPGSEAPSRVFLQTPEGRASCMEAWQRSGPMWRGNGCLRAMAV